MMVALESRRGASIPSILVVVLFDLGLNRGLRFVEAAIAREAFRPTSKHCLVKEPIAQAPFGKQSPLIETITIDRPGVALLHLWPEPIGNPL